MISEGNTSAQNMSELLLTIGIAFFLFLTFALLLNYCRRKLRKTPHGLTGMCHKTGETMCTSCQEKMDKDTPVS